MPEKARSKDTKDIRDIKDCREKKIPDWVSDFCR
jgi:hypothetical protein